MVDRARCRTVARVYARAVVAGEYAPRRGERDTLERIVISFRPVIEGFRRSLAGQSIGDALDSVSRHGARLARRARTIREYRRVVGTMIRIAIACDARLANPRV